MCLIDYSGEFRVENHTLAQEAEDGDLNGAFEIEKVITEVRVAASSDDAEENSSGRVSTNSSDLELTYDRGNQTVGMRFSGTAIPKGATIVNAYIQFQTDETQSGGGVTHDSRGRCRQRRSLFQPDQKHIVQDANVGCGVVVSPGMDDRGRGGTGSANTRHRFRDSGNCQPTRLVKRQCNGAYHNRDRRAGGGVL